MADQHSPSAPAPDDMVQCEVTGQTLPASETIVLHGKRVSAEGKRILLERIELGEGLPGEAEIAGLGRRLVAAIVDSLLFIVAGMLVGFGLGLGFMASPELEPDLRLQATSSLIVGGAGLLYFALLHAARGQTLGKMALKIRVVTLDGGPIDARAAWVRAFMYTGIGLLPSIPAVVLGDSFWAIYGVLGIATGAYGIANAITLIVTKRRRAIHDFAAGTKVVMATP